MTVAELKAGSHLPGPRGNLELLHRYADQATADSVAQCLAELKPDTTNSPEEFVGMCGVLGGALIRRDDLDTALGFLRPFAGHGSWRIREAVAMGLQELGTGRLDALLDALEVWLAGTPWERRAVVAGLAEPRLLKDPRTTARVLVLLDAITRALPGDRRLTSDEAGLRQALGYGWSVVVAALPVEGLPRFNALRVLGEPVAWVVRENLKKKRLIRLLPGSFNALSKGGSS